MNHSTACDQAHFAHTRELRSSVLSYRARATTRRAWLLAVLECPGHSEKDKAETRKELRKTE